MGLCPHGEMKKHPVVFPGVPRVVPRGTPRGIPGIPLGFSRVPFGILGVPPAPPRGTPRPSPPGVPVGLPRVPAWDPRASSRVQSAYKSSTGFSQQS